jgi:hypothetical protein
MLPEEQHCVAHHGQEFDFGYLYCTTYTEENF